MLKTIKIYLEYPNRLVTFTDVPYEVATIGANDALLAVYDPTHGERPVMMFDMSDVTRVEFSYADMLGEADATIQYLNESE